MNNEEMTIGQRVRKARKEKGYNQTELANALGKSLRTIQKYENGEIEISISMLNELAKALDTTTTYLLGYKTETVKPQITTFADVAVMLFELEKVAGLKFDIAVKRPPRNDNWECSIKFDGKAKTDLNADMCLFLEGWADARENYSTEKYADWKDKTLAYYSRLAVDEQADEAKDNAIKRKVTPAGDLENYDYKE